MNTKPEDVIENKHNKLLKLWYPDWKLFQTQKRICVLKTREYDGSLLLDLITEDQLNKKHQKEYS